ncbi:MAG: ExbD/TolR family protein [Burkholderiaceae bacterium]|nr:ExbD/TolR family protein [Burkholderiaceae bacterium]
MGAQTSPRKAGRRRMMNEINVVPYIDVTLVLLIIFMVTAPMIVTGTIDLPKVGQASQAPVAALELTIRQDGSTTIRRNTEGEKEKPIARDEIVSAVKSMSPSMEIPVIISAEKSVRYEHVISAMDQLQRAGFTRVGLNLRKE